LALIAGWRIWFQGSLFGDTWNGLIAEIVGSHS
jgi:hypothetical protein